MIAYQVQKSLIAHERRGPVQGLAVTARRRLLDKDQKPRVVTGRLAVDFLAPAANYHRDLLDARGNDLLQDDL